MSLKATYLIFFFKIKFCIFGIYLPEVRLLVLQQTETDWADLTNSGAFDHGISQDEHCALGRAHCSTWAPCKKMHMLGENWQRNNFPELTSV